MPSSTADLRKRSEPSPAGGSPRIRPGGRGSPKVAVAMLGARMHYAVPRLLDEAGLLDRFFTDSYVGNKPWLETALRRLPGAIGSKLRARWLGRSAPGLAAGKVTSFEILGLWYAFARRRARGQAETERVYRRMAELFARRILAHGLGHADAVWGFNTASLELFRAAKADGRLCILEQTILPRTLESRLLAREAARFPGWQPDLDTGDDGAAQAERERAEWGLADRIVAASEFVRDGLLACGVPAEKIVVIPYGVDAGKFRPRARPQPDEGPLKVLFAGEVGLRKGAPYLLEALSDLGPDRVRARFAGRVALDAGKLAGFAPVAEFLGAVPRSDMPALFGWADVFVLPSIVEGSATASYEAMLSGLPVVTTPNAGSIVRDGVEGRIVPVGDAAAIAEALSAYHRDRALLARHAAAAVEARERAGLDRYGRDLAGLIRGLVEPPSVVVAREAAE